eukprot:m.146008 g.146008  ORF g.146008 m.146008 type:complete len:333 (+) comp10087_c0_seq6:629-1627(+)
MMVLPRTPAVDVLGHVTREEQVGRNASEEHGARRRAVVERMRECTVVGRANENVLFHVTAPVHLDIVQVPLGKGVGVAHVVALRAGNADGPAARAAGLVPSRGVETKLEAALVQPVDQCRNARGKALGVPDELLCRWIAVVRPAVVKHKPVPAELGHAVVLHCRRHVFHNRLVAVIVAASSSRAPRAPAQWRSQSSAVVQGCTASYKHGKHSQTCHGESSAALAHCCYVLLALVLSRTFSLSASRAPATPYGSTPTSAECLPSTTPSGTSSTSHRLRMRRRWASTRTTCSSPAERGSRVCTSLTTARPSTSPAATSPSAAAVTQQQQQPHHR